MSTLWKPGSRRNKVLWRLRITYAGKPDTTAVDSSTDVPAVAFEHVADVSALEFVHDGLASDR